MAQKNFYVGHELKEDFERFCMENAYTESAVMAAGVFLFVAAETSMHQILAAVVFGVGIMLFVGGWIVVAITSQPRPAVRRRR